LSKLYEVDFKQTEGKAIITSLTTSGLARLGARAIKFIPGVGSVLGGITLAVLSGASSYALGEAFKKHFETGGTFLDFDPMRLKKYYDEKFEKGKEVAKEIQKQQSKKEKAVDTSNTIDKLKELADMKASGILSEEEFVALKKKIIES
ncbi:MAG: SHOCT domain-containing protein, partial [Saprospiraceae bacterium]|nr:SHOCT domain-containing protein [Saprospiraceae bacterium]